MIDKLYIMMPELVADNYDREAAKKYFEKNVEPAIKLVSAIFEEEPESFKQWLASEEGEQFKRRGIRKVSYTPLDPTASDYQEKLENMTKQQVNNAIFDLQWGIITNEASQIKLFNPGSFDVQKKSSRIISIARDTNNIMSYEELMSKTLDELDALIPKENRNILDATTQTYFFKQNMTAGKLIGVFANANVSHVFCNLLDIEIKEEFRFNGKSYKDAKWDPTNSARGRYVSKNIAGYVGASVDAVKDPVFANMNVNMNTVNPALILARLGVDPEEIALLTSQSIVVEFSKRMDAAKDKSSFVDAAEVMYDLLLEYGNSEDIGTVLSSLGENDFNAVDLFNNIKNEDRNFSLRVGVLFLKLLSMSDDMRGITYCTKFNSVTNAPGPLFTDNMYSQQRVDNFLKKVDDDSTMFNKAALEIIKSNLIIDSIYSATIERGNIVEQIASSYWKYYNPSFAYISNKLRSMIGRPISGEKLERVYQDYMLFCLDKHQFTTPADRNTIITQFPDRFVETLRKIEAENPEVYEREIKYNPFIQRIHRTTPSGKFPIATLQMESGKMNGEISEQMKNGWTAMVNSTNKDIKELGITLFFYNLYRSGFKYSPKTFLHLAPTDVKYAVFNYVNFLSDNSMFNLEDFESYEFILQYNRNHPDEFLYNREELHIREDSGSYLIDEEDITISVAPNGNFTVQPIIKYNNELYVAEHSTYTAATTEVRYFKVDRLGFDNDVVEYIYGGNHTVPSQIIPAVQKKSSQKKASSGVLSEGMTTKTTYKQNRGEADEVKVKPQPTAINQLTEEQLNTVLSSISDENLQEFLPLYKQGGILNASMSVEEMVQSVMDNIFKGVEPSSTEEVAQFNAMKQQFGDVHNQIINIIKDIC